MWCGSFSIDGVLSGEVRLARGGLAAGFHIAARCPSPEVKEERERGREEGGAGLRIGMESVLLGVAPARALAQPGAWGPASISLNAGIEPHTPSEGPFIFEGPRAGLGWIRSGAFPSVQIPSSPRPHRGLGIRVRKGGFHISSQG